MKEKINQFEALRPLLFSISYQMIHVKEEAEDILQETSIEWLKTTTSIENPKAYLSKIVVNKSLNVLKEARVKKLIIMDHIYLNPSQKS